MRKAETPSKEHRGPGVPCILPYKPKGRATDKRGLILLGNPKPLVNTDMPRRAGERDIPPVRAGRQPPRRKKHLYLFKSLSPKCNISKASGLG